MSSPLPRNFVIGDSFIGIFTLLNKKANMKVLKVKGGTLKGFSREGNEARVTMQQLLESPEPFQCGLFGFGQVDMNLSFYYDLIVKQQFNDDGIQIFHDSPIKVAISLIPLLA